MHVVERKLRKNGAFIEIVQVEKGHFLKDPQGKKYTVHCIDHGAMTGHDLILGAREIAANSTLWCRSCLDRYFEQSRPKKPRKRGRKIGSKNKPKPVLLGVVGGNSPEDKTCPSA